jgi:hypothetical protein
MSDIHDCRGCKEPVYMDNAESCIVCDDYFCGACDYESGITLWSGSNSNAYYVCKHCLNQGIEYINKENMDDATFTVEEYNRTIKELKSRKHYN